MNCSEACPEHGIGCTSKHWYENRMNPYGRELIHNHLSNSPDRIYCVWRTLKRGLEDEGKIKVDKIMSLISQGRWRDFRLLKEEKDVWTLRKQRYRTFST